MAAGRDACHRLEVLPARDQRRWVQSCSAYPQVHSMLDMSAPNISTIARIDEVCARFEEQLRIGSAPPVEQFFAPLAHDRSIADYLLVELLLLEWDYLGAHAQPDPVTTSRHANRFPDHREAIETAIELFRAAARGKSRCSARGNASRAASAVDDARPSASWTSVPRDFGPYRLTRLLGAGGMGQVFEARHVTLNRTVALKFLNGKSRQHAEAIQRFRREIEMTARASHPNVVSGYDAGELDSQCYLAMEYVDGVNLRQMVARHGPLPPLSTVDFALQTAAGLQHLHDLGIVHRDIKPSNLIVDAQGMLKIVDLGLAVFRRFELPDEVEYLTEQDAILGSTQYMAPEQAESASCVDGRADIYSLGCTLYYLLAGRAPFANRDPLETLIAHRELARPHLPGRQARAMRELERILHRMMAKRPDDRFASMLEVANQLTSWRDLYAHRRQLGHRPATCPRIRGDRRIKVSLLGVLMAVWAAMGASDLGPASVHVERLSVADSVVMPGDQPEQDESLRNDHPNRPPWAVAPFDASQAAKHQSAWAEFLRQPASVRNPIGMSLVMIPPGEFLMGTDPVSMRRLSTMIRAYPVHHAFSFRDETPQHRVRISQPYYMSATEVTVGQFRQFINATNYVTKARNSERVLIHGKNRLLSPQASWSYLGSLEVREDLPVVNLSFDDMIAFCRWLTNITGDHYRLPTEAEWEYACRAGAHDVFDPQTHPTTLREHAWFNDDLHKRTYFQPVAQKLPNPFGLFDMLGNIMEQCVDYYDPAYYAASPPTNPQGPGTEMGYGRVLRGGDYTFPAPYVRSANRNYSRDIPTTFVSFRVVRECGSL